MPTFYRIDYFDKGDFQSYRTSFEQTLDKAHDHCFWGTEKQDHVPENKAYLSIHPFNADSCDMEGWLNSDFETQIPEIWA